MKLSYMFAPAHRRIACAGVFLLSALAGACEKGPHLGGGNDRTLVLSGDTVQLAAGVTMHDVQVRSGQNVDFTPDRVTARAGDIVRFTVGDTRTHALVITAPTAEARAVLETSGQRRSPPLVSRETAWVVSLKGVPAGTYTVSCISHAGTATLIVE